MLGEARAAIETLPGLLARPRDPDTVHIPWQGWSLSTPDFLTTRMMEMVVHGDDLAASVGLPTPTYPDDVVAPVLALLTVRRGPAARPDRAGPGPRPPPAGTGHGLGFLSPPGPRGRPSPCPRSQDVRPAPARYLMLTGGAVR